MERNENGVPVTPRSDSGTNALDGFFKGQRAGNDGRDGCGKPKNGDTGMDICSDSLPLAYAYVPWQKWRLLYSPEAALANGTLFEELNKPLGVYGNE